MAIRVAPRALEVLRRALEVARLDPARIGITLRVLGSGSGAQVQTGFAEEPEGDDKLIEVEGLRLFVPASLADADLTIDVTTEHDRIIVR